MDSIKPLTEPLNTKRNWEERKKYVLAQGTHTMEELCELQSKDNTSLGIVRPKEIIEFTIESCDAERKGQWEALLKQERLFGPGQKPLEKIPFKFSYAFRCDDHRCSGHKMMIEDWELGQLYRSMKAQFRDPNIAAQGGAGADPGSLSPK